MSLSLSVAVFVVLRVNVLEYSGASKGLYWFETFYRIGSYIFGGGQVVLPLIVEQVVQYVDVCEQSIGKEVRLCVCVKRDKLLSHLRQCLASSALQQASVLVSALQQARLHPASVEPQMGQQMRG